MADFQLTEDHYRRARETPPKYYKRLSIKVEWDSEHNEWVARFRDKGPIGIGQSQGEALRSLGSIIDEWLAIMVGVNDLYDRPRRSEGAQLEFSPAEAPPTPDKQQTDGGGE